MEQIDKWWDSPTVEYHKQKDEGCLATRNDAEESHKYHVKWNERSQTLIAHTLWFHLYKVWKLAKLTKSSDTLGKYLGKESAMASGCGQVVSIWGCAVPRNPSRCTSVPFSAYLLYFKRRFNYRLMKHLANTAEEVAKMGRRGKEWDKCKPGYPRGGHLFQAIERSRRGRGKEGRSWPTVVLRFAQEPRQRGVTSRPLFPGNSHHCIDTLFPLPFPGSGRLVFSNLFLANSIQVLKAFKYHLLQRAIHWPLIQNK